MSNEEQSNVDILRDGLLQWNETKGESVEHWMNLIAGNL